LAFFAALFALVCCAGAEADESAPLFKSAAWQAGMAQLERYKQGGVPPSPLRIALLSAPSSFARLPALTSPPSASGGKQGGPLSALASANRASGWQGIIRQASRRYGVDEALLTAVMQVESNFNPYAVSRAGARGAMQIMPDTGRALGLKDFFDPVANTDAGARYLAEMLRLFPRLELSLAAYNAGPAAVRQYGGNIPPFPETRDYVQRVLSLYKQLTAQRVK
jgi:soluble lytic murein transglycosylase-like protein